MLWLRHLQPAVMDALRWESPDRCIDAARVNIHSTEADIQASDRIGSAMAHSPDQNNLLPQQWSEFIPHKVSPTRLLRHRQVEVMVPRPLL